MKSDYERALSALNHITPSCSREEWVRIGMAAKSAGLEFEDFHEWSRNGCNYKNEKDCRTVWKSIKTSGGITEATLFSEAYKQGWKNTNDSYANAENSNEDDASFNADEKSSQTFKNEKNNCVLNIWNRCIQAEPSHEYILRKKGETDGLRIYPAYAPPLIIGGTNVAGYLVIPCFSGLKLQTLQFIPPNTGKKLNLSGASFNDGYFCVGDITDVIYICEGIATSWATYQASGLASIVCFSVSRMMTVAKVLRAKYPNAKLILVPDRGQEELASKIALAVSGHLVKLPNDKDSNYDANDYVMEYGYDALANLLAEIISPDMRYKLLSGNDLMSLPPMRWILRGILPAEGLAALYGPSMSGKSFLVIDMACAIASGVEHWYGFRVTKSRVTYVCLEGEAGIGKRIKAWSQHSNCAIPDGLKFVIQSFNLLTDDINDLAKAITTTNGAGGIVILDTLNRATPGADENSSVDTGKIIAAASRLQKIIGGLVLIVHHTGKDETKGLRAHSSLFAALDATIKLSNKANQREWMIEKSKDGESGKSFPFELKIIKVGIDEYGDEVTSCAVVPRECIDGVMLHTLPPKSGNQKIIWEALKKLFLLAESFGEGGAPEGRPCIRLDEAIEKTRGRLPCEQKRQTERTQAAITGLISRGLLEHRNGWIWMV